MKTFKKHILSPSTYLVNVPGGGRSRQTFSASRVEHFHDEFKRMKKAGLDIPISYTHSLSALPRFSGEVDPDPRLLAGWIDDVELAKDGSLWGIVTPRTDADAEQIKTLRETSPLILPEFIDGKGTRWEDVVCHLAICTRGIVQDQHKGFKPLAASHAKLPCYFLSMSDQENKAMADDVAPDAPKELDATSTVEGATLADLLKALRGEPFKLDLPDDTSEENFVERMLVAVRAVRGNGNGEKSEVPDGAETKPPVVAMSHKAALTLATKAHRETLRARIKALPATVIVKADSDKLIEQANAYQLSFNDKGEVLADKELDATLKTLEMVARAKAPQKPGHNVGPSKTGAAALSHSQTVPPDELGGATTEQPPSFSGDLDQKRLDELINDGVKLAGGR